MNSCLHPTGIRFFWLDDMPIVEADLNLSRRREAVLAMLDAHS
jgi:hypothetical protein